jgi:hypothetical protein
MKIRRAAIAAMAGVVATALATLPAGAQEPPLLPISVTPSSGSEGTLVTVSGSDCLSESGPGDVELYVWYEDEEEPDVFGIVPDEVGAWSIEYTIESTATNPVGLYEISATCFESPDSEVVIADYDFATFEVTAPPVTTPPPTEPPAQPPVDQPEAPPATPVPAQPTFTG